MQRESVITGHLFLTVFAFAMTIYGTPTLNQLTGLVNALLPEIKVSREAFHQRINEQAVSFFEAMLSLAINLEIPEDIELSALDAFKRVLLFDSTSFQLPETLVPYFKGSGGCSSNSVIKIIFGYDFKSAQFFYVLLNGTDADHLINNGMMGKIRANDLVLVDLGYFGVPTFVEINDKGAFLLSRLRSYSTLYIKNEETGELEEFDIVAYLKTVSDKPTEAKIYLKSGKQTIQMRLIAERVPEDVKEERLRKLNKTAKKKGRQPRKKTKILKGFNLHITNASAKDMPTKKVRKFYTIRWQIELIFKSWKSNFKLDEVSGIRPERIKSMIYAKLLLIFIITKITRLASIHVWNKSQREVSEFQAAKHFEIVGHIWMNSIVKEPSKVNEILLNAFLFITKSCLKTKSNKRTYPIQIMNTIDAASP